MLIDTGPLFAMADARQADHARCRAVYDTFRKPLTTTWAVMAETLHLTGRNGGWTMQSGVWALLEDDSIIIHHADVAEQRRIRALMSKYQDRPMDLADATLVAAAETLGVRQIFTIDSDFYVYRIHDTETFEVLR